MINITCTSKSCVHRDICRVVANKGSMTPKLVTVLGPQVRFSCASQRLKRNSPKPSATKAVIPGNEMTATIEPR